MIRISLLSFFILASFASTFAQDKVADKIIAVVGKKIILQSELDQQYESEKNNNPTISENDKCYLFYTLIAQQILVEQAGRDSIIVSDEDVNAELDRRIGGMEQAYGSKERLEEASGKTVYQLKESYKDFFRDKLTAERMQAKLMTDVKITPTEVSAFFNKFPKDSLPPIPATAELGQIVVSPKINPIVEKLTKERLEDIRNQIVKDGKDFSTMASIYSADPSSKDKGGLIDITRKGFDPQFVAAAYRLQPGEISPVIRSKFGYHIIKMEKRMGDKATVRHILLIPEITSIDLNNTIKKLDSVRADLISGKIEFNAAVAKYSNDDQSKMNGGMATDDHGNSTLRIDDLKDPQLANAITNLKVGEFSQPQIFTNPATGTKACRILMLKMRTNPHILNLTDDYSQIQEKALQNKQNDFLHNWLSDHIGSYYVKIDPAYQSCPDLKGWDNAN